MSQTTFKKLLSSALHDRACITQQSISPMIPIVPVYAETFDGVNRSVLGQGDKGASIASRSGIF